MLLAELDVSISQLEKMKLLLVLSGKILPSDLNSLQFSFHAKLKKKADSVKKQLTFQKCTLAKLAFPKVSVGILNSKQKQVSCFLFEFSNTELVVQKI